MYKFIENITRLVILFMPFRTSKTERLPIVGIIKFRNELSKTFVIKLGFYIFYIYKGRFNYRIPKYKLFFLSLVKSKSGNSV